MRVIKRDGTIVAFDRTKIENAIQKAFDVTVSGGYNCNDGIGVVNGIVENLSVRGRGRTNDEIDIEDIQDAVENGLMISGNEAVAKAYILYREERARLREKRKDKHPDKNALSDYIHHSKYAKVIQDGDKQRCETWLETSHRCRDMHLRKFFGCLAPEYKIPKEHFSQPKQETLWNLINWAWKFVDEKKVLPSMRSMQFGGQAIEDQNARMYNCSFTHIDRPEVFQQIFYLLLCGCGVGYSVQKQHVEKLPIIKPLDGKLLRHHTVKDSIQGWADSVGILMDSFFTGYYAEFNYSDIRSQGSPLKISGGKAPGHFPLKRLHSVIRDILPKIVNRKLRPIEVHDILCHIADAVLSGGIRRSSLISLFSVDDEDMLTAKMPENFQHYGKNGQRALANNSAVLLREKVTRKDGLFAENMGTKIQFLKIMELNRNNPNGEPGFFFTNDLDYGCNPCGEIGLYPVWDKHACVGGDSFKHNDIWAKESGIAFCNLTEVNCSVCKTKEEFLQVVKAAAIIGTLQAAYTDFPYLGKVTEEIVKRDALLGVSLTGMMDNPSIALQPDIQKNGVIIAHIVNKEVAELIGINPAKRLTTVKPSGTASLLLGGIGSGIHPHHSRRYFRRITANKHEVIAQEFIKINPHMVEHKPNGDLSIVFPIEAPTCALIQDALTVGKFLEYVFITYDNWIKPGSIGNEEFTHNISCTVCFRPEEYEGMIEQIWVNRNRIAAMAFIPYMSDKEIPFMPRESVITEEDEIKWNKLITQYKPIDYKSLDPSKRSSLSLELACTKGDGTCGVVHTQVEDTMEIFFHHTRCDYLYEQCGVIKDSFGKELILVRRK